MWGSGAQFEPCSSSFGHLNHSLPGLASQQDAIEREVVGKALIHSSPVFSTTGADFQGSASGNLLTC